MNLRIGLPLTTASFLLILSGGVSAQTPQTIPMNPLEARRAMMAARAARLSQKAPATPEIGVKPDGTGCGPGPVSYTFSVLHAFTGGADGGFGYSGVVLDPHGNLYGTRANGGDLSVGPDGSGDGVVFKLDPFGKLTALHTFTGGAGGGMGGASVDSTPILDNAGNLYGATWAGGAFSNGVVFKIDPKQNETVLYNLTMGQSGYDDFSAYLLRDKAGDLYGTLYQGGAAGCGTVFKVGPSAGKESTLFTFGVGADAPCNPDPYGPLIQDAQGNLYGLSESGGRAGAGTVYKLDPAGKPTVLYSFPTTDYYGNGPTFGLIRDDQGSLYGVNPSYPSAGEVFKLDPSGNLTVLYTFTGGTDGGSPNGPLIRDTEGNLFGTTYGGGDGAFGGYGCGVVFKLDPFGNETVLHTFNFDAGGCAPYSGLVTDEQGNLYGATQIGGDLACSQGFGDGCGTVFKLTRSPQLPW